MDTKTIILIVVGVLVAAVVGYLWWKQEKKTAAQKCAEAKANGWSYERGGGNLDRRYRHLPFVDGDSESVKHVMRGELRGRPVTLFTYEFDEERFVERGILADNDRNNDGERDKERVKRHYGVAVVGLPTSLPRFELSAASLRHARRSEERTRVGGVLSEALGDVLGDEGGKLLFGKSHTGGGVETGDAAFDEQFVVKSTNPDAVRALLTPSVRQWLLTAKRAQRYVVWVDENEIITWGTGTETELGRAKAVYLNDFLDQLPGLGAVPTDGSATPGGEASWGPPPA